MLGGNLPGMRAHVDINAVGDPPAHSEPLPAWQWRIGDLVKWSAGPPVVITLHRLEGAPGQVVVEFGGLDGQVRCDPNRTAMVNRLHAAA